MALAYRNIGLNQEYRAGQVFAALKRLAVSTVRVCRAGHWQPLSSRQLVPGDLVLLLEILCLRTSERDSFFKIGLFTNPIMLGAAIATFLLQLAAIYVPALQSFFQTAALSMPELGISLGVSTIGVWGVELEKWIVRRPIKLRRSAT